MSKGRKTAFIILCILTGLTVAFIWGNSCLPKATSGAESSSVYDAVIKPFFAVFEGLFGVEFMTPEIARKLAHAFEFFVLATEINLLYATKLHYGWKFALYSLFFSFTVAFLDETIQVISERGPMITDVYIDFVGALIGTLLVFLIAAAVDAGKKRRRKTREEKPE